MTSIQRFTSRFEKARFATETDSFEFVTFNKCKNISQHPRKFPDYSRFFLIFCVSLKIGYHIIHIIVDEILLYFLFNVLMKKILWNENIGIKINIEKFFYLDHPVRAMPQIFWNLDNTLSSVNNHCSWLETWWVTTGSSWQLPVAPLKAEATHTRGNTWLYLFHISTTH